MADVIEITQDNFEQVVLKADKPVMVDFNATWCGPCKQFGPIFHEFAAENGDKVVCAAADVDKNRELAMTYHVSAVPTTIIFKDGKPVNSMMGASDKNGLINALNKVL